jgi:hypothetical protein
MVQHRTIRQLILVVTNQRWILDQTLAIQEFDFRVYQLYTNTDVEIQSLGFGLGLSKKYTEILKWVLIITMLNLNLTKQRTSFEAGFNTPKHRVKASFETKII